MCACLEGWVGWTVACKRISMLERMTSYFNHFPSGDKEYDIAVKISLLYITYSVRDNEVVLLHISVLIICLIFLYS